jgi:hypothetical protein
MRVLTFTLLLCLCLINISKAQETPTASIDAMCIFDPATVDPTTLPQGMEIVDMGGKKYVQIVLNGWSSIIKVPTFNLKAGMSASCDLKFSIGDASVAAGYSLAKINATVQLMDTINQIKNPWGEGMVASSQTMGQSPATGLMSKVSASKISADMKLVNQIQFFGQQTISWGSTTGDTLWVGKIRAQIIEEGVIFNPINLEPNDKMSVVEIDGKKYAQIVLNGWNSTINVPEFKIAAGLVPSCNIKYSLGSASKASGLTLEKINSAVQLMDTINKVKNPWGEGMVPSSVAMSKTASNTIGKVTAKFSTDMKMVHQIQLFGQETVSWGATTADTIWVGKVRAVVPNDATTIVDPANYDAENLHAGWEIVTIDGTKYFKVALKSWDNVLPIDEFKFPAGTTDFSASIKYETGTSGFDLAKINTFFKLANVNGTTWTEIGAAGAPSSSTFKTYKVSVKDASLKASVVQVAGQETTGWSAVTGDYIYIGKVTTNAAAPKDPNIIFDPATFDGALGAGWEIVTLDGVKYFKVKLNGWSSWTNVPEYSFPAGTTGFKASVKLEKGNPDYDVEDINVFMKFSTSGWTEIAAGSGDASDKFKNYMINVADPSMKAGVFQVAAQEDVSGGGTALVGDVIYISKVVAVKATPVTFIVDDSADKTYEGFMLKGSWLTASGEYDTNWNGGVEHTQLYDDGTHGDAVAADNIWTVKLYMLSDAGKNTWEWGFNDLEETWIPSKNTQFKVADDKAVTTTYVIPGEVGINDFSANWNIYPNPAKDQINIQGLTVKSVAIFNLTGSKVMESTKNSFNISSLNKGIYMVKITDENGKVAVKKLNKN